MNVKVEEVSHLFVYSWGTRRAKARPKRMVTFLRNISNRSSAFTGQSSCCISTLLIMQRTALNTARAIASSSRLTLTSRTSLPASTIPPIARYASVRPPRPSRPARFVLPPPPHPSFPDLIHNLVQVVDSDTGKLRPPQLLSAVFAEIDPKTHYPLLVSADPPLVRIKNVAEHIDAINKIQIATQARKKLLTEAKEIQVPWSSADGDVKVKLAFAEDTLVNGGQAIITFAPKAAGGTRRAPTTNERKSELVRMFDDGLKSTGVKWRTDEVMPKWTKQYYHPLPEVKKEAEQRGIEHTGERKKASHDKKEARRIKDEERRLKSLAARSGQQDANDWHE